MEVLGGGGMKYFFRLKKQLLFYKCVLKEARVVNLPLFSWCLYRFCSCSETSELEERSLDGLSVSVTV